MHVHRFAHLTHSYRHLSQHITHTETDTHTLRHLRPDPCLIHIFSLLGLFIISLSL